MRASTDRSLHVKQDEFFSYVTKVLKTDEEASAMRQLANWILIISMLRIVQATGVHPRLGILTGSVAVSVDDFMHFFALFMAVLCSFAGIGFWRFGPVRDDFGTFGETATRRDRGVPKVSRIGFWCFGPVRDEFGTFGETVGPQL
ncbi:hypothetical protein T484DRAFT_1781355 [Baffinella frigidus]|nr:hypothetical protein T484DRAFT_1781355 [Cryptophyta sp. CCMP2293]